MSGSHEQNQSKRASSRTLWRVRITNIPDSTGLADLSRAAKNGTNFSVVYRRRRRRRREEQKLNMHKDTNHWKKGLICWSVKEKWKGKGDLRLSRIWERLFFQSFWKCPLSVRPPIDWMIGEFRQVMNFESYFAIEAGLSLLVSWYLYGLWYYNEACNERSIIFFVASKEKCVMSF